MKNLVIILVVLFGILFSGIANAQDDQLWSLTDSIISLRQKDSILKRQILVLEGEIALRKHFLSETKSPQKRDSLKKEINFFKDSIRSIRPCYRKELKTLKKSWANDSMQLLWDYNGFPKGSLNNCPDDENKVLYLIEQIQKANIDPELKKEILYHASFLLQRGMTGLYTLNKELLNEVWNGDAGGAICFTYYWVSLLDCLFATELCYFPPLNGAILTAELVTLVPYVQKKEHMKEIYEASGFRINLHDLPYREEAKDFAHKNGFRSIRAMRKTLREAK